MGTLDIGSIMTLKARQALVMAVAWVAVVLSCLGANASCAIAEPTPPAIAAIWANTGEDKVTRHDLRAGTGRRVVNSVWDGTTIKLFGARNEVVSFNLLLETGRRDAPDVSVKFDELHSVGGGVIQTRHATRDDLWKFNGRNIELFYVRYLPIKGISTLTFNYWVESDSELNLPTPLRRPHSADGKGAGGWRDRPGAGAFYPDIAVPLELHTPFRMPPLVSQSIWGDIFIPKNTPPGHYSGTIQVFEGRTLTRSIPLELTVGSFTLPDIPTARTMLYVNPEEINRRYFGREHLIEPAQIIRSRARVDLYFQLAHRHKISLITPYMPMRETRAAWADLLTGRLFTPGRGYDGVGIGVGNNVFSLGTYTTWPWTRADEQRFMIEAGNWMRMFASVPIATPTTFLLYLLDESRNYETIQKWSSWLAVAHDPGKRLLSFATIPLPAARKRTPALMIPASTPDLTMQSPATGMGPQSWQDALRFFQKRPGGKVFLYNGSRPLSGTFAIEDDGIAPREISWSQYKFNISRWFYWEGTYYANSQYGAGDTNVFQSAHTYGKRERVDPVFGETGDNYDNGNGVLFYPGTDRIYAAESYDQP
ncbi:MAG: hypothetical protein ACK5JT_20080, partial [Hyphomicrobiaceae bacterium]